MVHLVRVQITTVLCSVEFMLHAVRVRAGTVYRVFHASSCYISSSQTRMDRGVGASGLFVPAAIFFTLCTMNCVVFRLRRMNGWFFVRRAGLFCSYFLCVFFGEED